MELDFAILADGASNRPDGKLDIYGAGFDSIFAAQVPATHPQMALVLRILVTRHELESDHTLMVALLGPDGQELARAEAQIPTMPAEQRSTLDPSRSIGIGMVLNFASLTFATYDLYGFKIHWDGNEIKDMRLHVSPLPPGPPAA